MENCSSATTIEDLVDKLLIEIFVRLPCYESVITSKFVSKRWLSLLSNPKFVIQFLNHKNNLRKKLPLQQQQLPWSFLCTTQLKTITNDDESPNHKVFNSPKFSLNFLPFQFKVVSTFKDLVLVLCLREDGINNNHSHNYIICNPFTKQWVVLPPTPSPINHALSWAALICEDPNYNEVEERIDYRFRVVVLHPKPNILYTKEDDPFSILNLMVFCSEDYQWKNANLRIPLTLRKCSCSCSFSCCGYTERLHFEGVVCKGMVCLCHNLYFGMFDPFKVTTTPTTIEAILLPLPDSRGRLLECGGRLISVYDKSKPIYSDDNKKGMVVTIHYIELDLNQFIENTNNDLLLPGLWKGIRNRCVDNSGSISVMGRTRRIGLHPCNTQLFYMSTGGNKNKLVLCDKRSSCVKILGELHPDCLDSSKIIELQYWPTPVPVPTFPR
ncbi:hypothetical protein SOVF_035320 [Spinacia oleracea]|uniref:F-box domain-containing protein n=1 Tax=Spinacia oleracea TaxID=3562 RepID=A0A9R0J8G0_SPIOL|nr:uncharacterized protein LOC110801328 [Spinacia oleracea]XP_021862368.2 uncharacterized protein LOC110801328 [Spinacia oleracea]XP_056686813.1 uncharacterized protein LOC110801328 [Spinacia oleracea]KNA22292.1 hypothetical protein SOVF_035320 [Spinacia oleracea]